MGRSGSAGRPTDKRVGRQADTINSEPKLRFGEDGHPTPSGVPRYASTTAGSDRTASGAPVAIVRP
jgi:hypothetical protein